MRTEKIVEKLQQSCLSYMSEHPFLLAIILPCLLDPVPLAGYCCVSVAFIVATSIFVRLFLSSMVMLKRLLFIITLGATMHTVTVKVDEELKRKMGAVRINWSQYIREAIRRRVELEERKRAAEKLLEGLKTRKHVVPKGFINKTIRETRETR